MYNENKIRELELFYFGKDIEWIENQELDLIFDPLTKQVLTHSEYDKICGLVEWECAICGKKILIDKHRNDVENFVCDRCKVAHNNTNESIDRRILDSRNKFYEETKENILLEFEDNVMGMK